MKEQNGGIMGAMIEGEHTYINPEDTLDAAVDNIVDYLGLPITPIPDFMRANVEGFISGIILALMHINTPHTQELLERIILAAELRYSNPELASYDKAWIEYQERVFKNMEESLV